MMRHHAKLATGLAALAVLPSLFAQGELEVLGSALGDVVESLRVLERVSTQVETAPEEAKPVLLGITEPPHLPQVDLDGRLDQLRHQVSLLQMELDSELARFARTTGADAGGGDLAPMLSTGISDSLRRVIQNSLGNRSTRVEATSGGAPPERPDETRVATSVTLSHEVAEGYSADPLGEAKASYYAGRFEDALRLTEGLPDTEARYLRARCLTRVDRFEEAIELLTKLVEEGGDSYEGRRAATDVEFVRWKMEFAGGLPEGLRDKGSR